MIFINLLVLAYSFLSNLIHGYEDSLGLSHSCKYRCDLHRSGGWSGEYEFDCIKAFDNEDERDYCMRDCWKCPEFVCNRTQPNIFNCPSTDIEGDCKRRCDLNRQPHILDGYILNCEETEYDEIFSCKQDCVKCPNWVCNEQEDRNTYHCPTLAIDDACDEICEDMRKRKYPSEEFTDIFFAVCSDYYPNDISKCNETCGKCPRNVCNPKLHSDGKFYFNCPRVGEPELLTTTLRSSVPIRKWEGRCKDRCDKFRVGGGTGKYSLDCQKFFTVEDEIEKCREDCKYCPKRYCDPENYKGGPYFHCPALEDHGADQDMIAKLTGAVIAMTVIAVILMVTLSVVITLGYLKLQRRGVVRLVRVAPQAATQTPQPQTPQTLQTPQLQTPQTPQTQDERNGLMLPENDASQSQSSPPSVLQTFANFIDTPTDA